MGLPVSLALRGRHTDDARARLAWQAVMDDLREVDGVFSTYRADSFVSRLGRGEVVLGDGPPEVAEVLALGALAEEQSGGAFRVRTGDPCSTRRAW
jgi:thiamine biosynthesis lipoprotein